MPDAIRDAESSLTRLDKIKNWEEGLPKLTPDMTEEQLQSVERQFEDAKTLVIEFGEESKPNFLLVLNRLLYYRARKMLQEELDESKKLSEVAPKVFGEKHPEVAAALFLKAECENRKGMTGFAIEDYKKCLSANDDSGFPVVATQLRGLLRLAQTYSGQKRHIDSIPIFEKYITARKQEGVKNDAEFGSIYNQLGVCQTAVGQHEKAMASFQESYALFTQFVPKDAPIVKTVESNFEHAKGELNKSLASQVASVGIGPNRESSGSMGSLGGDKTTATRPLNGDNRTETKAVEPNKTSGGPSFYLIVASLFLTTYISMRAKEKGYGGLRWFWAALCSCTSPVLAPCVLAMLPDRRIAKRREALFKLLDAELASIHGSMRSPIEKSNSADLSTLIVG